jgi:hypothetical protein
MNVFCCPGVVQSRALALKLGFEIGEAPEFGFRARIPRHKGHVELVAFLASERGAFMTGADYIIDGGTMPTT